MHFTATILATTTLLAITSAIPSPQTTVNPNATTTWTVTNFTEGCSPGGCVYSFNISGPAFSNAPAFATYCSGIQDPTTVPGMCASTEFHPVVTTDQTLVQTRDFSMTWEYPQADGNLGVQAGNTTVGSDGNGVPITSFEVVARFYGEIVE